MINLPLCPSFFHSLASATLLQYKTSVCKLRFVCTQSVLQIAQAVRLPFLYEYTICMYMKYLKFQYSLPMDNLRVISKVEDFLDLIFPRGEVAKVLPVQAKSSNKSVSGTEWSSASLMLKCLCELRKACPF